MTSDFASALKRLLKATLYSVQGIKAAFREEQAFRQEFYLALVLAPLGLWLGESSVERVLLVGALILVLIVELINSGIEAVVDRFGGEIHELSGRAKDVGSAAVFLALINVIFVWGLLAFN